MAVSYANTIVVLALEPLTQIDAHALVDGNYPQAVETQFKQEDSDLVPWTIENKYYTARTQFRIQTVSSLHSSAPEIPTEEQALIVLVERTKTPTDATRKLLKTLQDVDFEVALLVTVASRGQQPRQHGNDSMPDSEAWDDLALDQGFEWVDVDLDERREATETVKADGDERGMQRIVEALHANMWDDMELTQQHSKPAPPDTSMDPSQTDTTNSGFNDDEDDDDDDPDFGSPQLPQAKPYVPLKVTFPDTFLPNLDRSRLIKSNETNTVNEDRHSQMTGGFDDDFAPFVSALDARQQRFEEAGAHEGGVGRVGDDDRVEQFESLLNQLQGLRTTSQHAAPKGFESSGADHQTEEQMLRERRDRAENMLMQMLGDSSFD
ncbi:hypothetical protein ACM66B_005632 [Microbotryomycetes sp. NB124-2]